MTKLVKQMNEPELGFIMDRLLAIAKVVVDNEKSVREQMVSEGIGNAADAYIVCMKKVTELISLKSN
jgi:hypothetical protein